MIDAMIINNNMLLDHLTNIKPIRWLLSIIPQIGDGGVRRGDALTSRTRGPRWARQEVTAQWEAECANIRFNQCSI